VAPLAIFAVLAWQLAFVQDDAYIYFRYVANAAAGHGLTFNLGERVEGFTSPSWLALLLVARIASPEVIGIARLIGLLFGAGLILLTFLFVRNSSQQNKDVLGLAASLMVGTSLPLAYWAGAGLETSLFCFLFGLSLYLFVRRSYLLMGALGALVWTRPEGPLVVGLLLVAEALIERRWPRFMLRCTGAAALIWLPGELFRLWYFQSWFPNPFYAKVPFDREQLISGLEYAGLFVREYPYFLIGLLAPLVTWRKGEPVTKSIWVVTIGYFVYVVLIGGDTLKVHRFFLPLLFPLAYLTVRSLADLATAWRKVPLSVTVPTLCVLFCASTAVWQWRSVTGSADRERALTYNMTRLYDSIAGCDSTNFTIAATTIGAFGYRAMDHTLIDMLGLTDSMVARHPQDLATGRGSSWKERKFNAEYVLERAPDYIVFSTGIKPSAPAERALLRYPQFLESYRPMFYGAHLYPETTEYVLDVAFRKVRPVSGQPEVGYPVAFVEQFFEGERQMSAGNWPRALAAFDQALNVCGDRKPWVDLLYRKAACLVMMHKGHEAYLLMSEILVQDSLAVGPHRDLYVTALSAGNKTKALIHRQYLERLTPCELPALDSLAQAPPLQ
jgi:arabinofuranosyltransferase